MGELIRHHRISFSHALAGVRWALATQPNFRVHLLFATLAVLTGVYVRLSRVEWSVLVLTIVWVLAAEMTNTAIEALTDLVTQEWKKEAKIAKDVAAGMMLTVAFGSAGIAVILFFPKLLALL